MDSLQFQGQLTGHRDWVTSIATTYEQSNLVVSSSRDKKLMMWELTSDPENPQQVGYARRLLSGHSEPVSCALLSLGTTVKLCQEAAIKQSNCGTHWQNASTPSV